MTLTGEKGDHVSTSVEIFFYINDSRGDNILIGSTYTDSSGRASIYYTPQNSGSIKAVFNGTAVSARILVMGAVIAYLRLRSRKSAVEKEPSRSMEEGEKKQR